MIMIYTIGRKIKIGIGGMLLILVLALFATPTVAETVERPIVRPDTPCIEVRLMDTWIEIRWKPLTALGPEALTGDVIWERMPMGDSLFVDDRTGRPMPFSELFFYVPELEWVVGYYEPDGWDMRWLERKDDPAPGWSKTFTIHMVRDRVRFRGMGQIGDELFAGYIQMPLDIYFDMPRFGYSSLMIAGLNGAWTALELSDEWLGLYFEFDVSEVWAPINTTPARRFVEIDERMPSLLSGFTGTWGKSVGRLIPGEGEVSLVVTDELRHTLGILFEGYPFSMNPLPTAIGTVDLQAELRDLHSLDPVYRLDSSYTRAEQTLVITTGEAPRLNLFYPENVLSLAGEPLSHLTEYTPGAVLLPCGGVEGWTRFAPDVNVNVEHIPGIYAIEMTRNNEFWARLQRPDHGFVQYSNDRDGTGPVFLSAVLTDTGDPTLELSERATTHYKLDTSAPEVSATYHGGFTFTDNSSDDLSGIASEHYPTEIAFTTPSDSSVAPTDGWEELANHSMQTTGRYDVWVRATDKAANRTETKVFSDLFVGGEVNITKNTEEGAVLHMWNCSNVERIEIRNGCDDIYCSVGALPELLEMTDVTYQLTITNDTLINDTLLSDPLIYDILLKDNALGSSAVGTFEDFLPRGVVLVEGLSAVASGEATVSVDSELMTQGSYAGRYRVWGSYSNLAMGEQIYVTIPATTPAFEEASQEIPDVDNLIINQASTNWTIGESTGTIQGSNVSNFATHKVLITPGVDTWFIKTGSDSSGTGLAGAQFALYRWAGEAEPTHAARSHMVDVSVVVDDTLEEGDWVRVKYGGEEIGELTDFFVSNTSPLGEVDLGRLLKGTYTLIETRAPEGYDLPIGQWILTVDPEKMDTGTDDWKIEFVGKSNSMMPPGVLRIMGEQGPTYQLMNIRPFSIGMSGLAGTKGLLLIGFSLMAVAGNIYLVYGYKQRRKMKEAWK